MKVILIGNFPTCILLYQYLSQHKYLDALCFQELKNVYTQENFWKKSVQKEGFETFLINKKNSNTTFKTFLEKRSPDLVMVCGFSIKIPKELLQIPTYGFLNIHFGKLPENRGPNPIFWSIKNGDTQTAITAHKMDENWDTGDILITQTVPIIPGETSGMLNSKMSLMLGELIQKAVELVKNPINFKPQSDQNECYFAKPVEKERTIDWETQTADEIEYLINACNPTYGGATTFYRGTPIKIVEVSPVGSQTPLFGRTPGEIVHAHPQEGLFICCKYGQLLRINIISSDAGVLTGTKYVNLGIRQGNRFTTKTQKHKESITD